MIQSAVHDLRDIAIELRSFMPNTSEKILEAIRTNKKPENLFPRLP
jgi:methionyl-tRNA synthetase